MSLYTARVGVTARNQILEQAAAWNMTLAETVRALCILGLGGTWDDCLTANTAALTRKEALAKVVRETAGVEINQSRQKGPFVQPDSEKIVGASVGLPWSKRLYERGSFKDAVLSGLARVVAR